MEHFKLKFDSVARSEAIVMAGNARFTLLTSRLIRLEYSENGKFEDRASQPIWHRHQPTPEFEVSRDGDHLTIETEYLRLSYHQTAAGFTSNTLSIHLKKTDALWRYGDIDQGNLLGTTRTLDEVSGQTVLEPGLLSRAGWTVIDDSNTLVFDANGWLQNRESEALDLYFLGYGHDYRAALGDYFKLTGKIPLLPRFVLGNWWSRYWAYTQEELTNLMLEFIAQEVPLSVCIVDMDWHITETGNQSSGWTGYTWNRALFPDSTGFIKFLHEIGLKTALNLHPADGIHPHEATHAEMVKRLQGKADEPVKFAIANPDFTKAYFEVLHHPFEDQGVDFWWMDWQQGKISDKAGLDPLWWLNHLHFLDLGRNGKKRPFIFSRWGGLGNHRYPIGFSGDTYVTWESLAYQPYFTATAANVGYGWWSHDIGGHCFGVEEAELYTRWVQYGVFSPILRLHSTKNPFHERLPWGYDAETARITSDAMRLRHALIPYLYSMSWRAYAHDLQPIVPMYHDYPEEDAAYSCPNQYTFGSELIAAPYIFPINPETRLSRQVVWLPAGTWFNFFNGFQYAGDSWNAIYGTMEDIPVFAKAGAIVPLAPEVGWGGVDNPIALDVYVFPGSSHHFELYEDDGETTAYLGGAFSLTTFRNEWSEEGKRQQFSIEPVTGALAHLPEHRAYTLHFRGLVLPDTVEIQINNAAATSIDDYIYDAATRTLILAAVVLAPTDRLMVTLSHGRDLMANVDPRLIICQQMVKGFKLDTQTKRFFYDRLPEIVADYTRLGDWITFLKESQVKALLEVLTGAGVDYVSNAAPEHQPLILWNNHADNRIHYRLHTRSGWRQVVENDVVPGTKIHLPAESHQWGVQLSYGNLLTVTAGKLPD